MTCPKCQTGNANPIVSWTITGRKMTMPQLRLWACLNPTCLHKWRREASELAPQMKRLGGDYHEGYACGL
jgi:hypothetical protein